MFTIKTSTIRERTTNGPTYMNGRACYRNGQVGEVSFDSDKGLIQARVEGTQPYQVRIILNRDGAIHDTSCTCSAFTSYWGDCKHIAAVLLYGIDHFGAAKVETAQQQTRKGRIKAREFISQASRRAQILQNAGKQLLKLHAVMACGNNPSTLPTLTLQVFNGRLHPVSHVEQFLDALCRDLPFEIDEHLTYDPFLHRFDPSDEALLNLLLDAYEQDYKATFGSAAAARSEKILILNASRAAAFLRLAAQQTRYRWSTLKGTESYPIHVSESAMPIRLLVTESGTGDGLYRLVRQPGPALLQLTASRNIYLVDDTFYLPSRDTIRLLDPVLSLFAVPGTSQLTLSEEEVAELVGLPDPALQAVCPIDVSESLQQRLVKEPLTAKIRLEGAQEGLKADLQFHYGQLIISPYAPAAPAKGGDEREKIIVRQKLSEQAILDKLELAGFRRQGLFHLLSDYEAIYRFLDEGQNPCRTEQSACSMVPVSRSGFCLHLSSRSRSMSSLKTSIWKSGSPGMTCRQKTDRSTSRLCVTKSPIAWVSPAIFARSTMPTAASCCNFSISWSPGVSNRPGNGLPCPAIACSAWQLMPRHKNLARKVVPVPESSQLILVYGRWRGRSKIRDVRISACPTA